MNYLIFGFTFGLSASLAPGPLSALVMQRSLQGGFASGVRVALAPLLSDIPIIILAFLVVGRIPEAGMDVLMAIGGLFVLWLGIEAWRHTALETNASIDTSARQDLLHGALINFLNPHPYLFWIAIGAPTMVRAWRIAPSSALVFILAFYIMLIGGKIVLAVLFSSGRKLPPKLHHSLIRFSAILLLVAGIYMLFEAGQNLLVLL